MGGDGIMVAYVQVKRATCTSTDPRLRQHQLIDPKLGKVGAAGSDRANDPRPKHVSNPVPGGVDPSHLNAP